MKKKFIVIIGLFIIIITIAFFSVAKTIIPDTSLNNLKKLSGKKINSKEFLNKPLIINFWGTYCAPCKESLPYFEELSTKYGDKINIILVSDEDRTVIENFKKINNYNLNFLIDDKKSSFPAKLIIKPMTFFYNKKRKLVSLKIGAISRDELIEIMNKL
ncbi:TlpA family protein disulfide reductase [Chryseobacterium sp. KCF3-3]|uniref:TlpA family protein disulfide reductase n=1 Tax=Chryseobacterium sp. KCF3-3 TaxID=3231511 RepID=UPI0038B247B7